MYKLIAIDMDGTLLNDHHEVTAEVRDALHAAKAEGVKIVLCTGRPIGGVRRYLDELNLIEEGDYVIAYNGALVQNTHTKEVVTELSLGYDDLASLYDLSLELETPMHFFDSANLYTPNRDISEFTVYESYVTQVPLHYRKIEEMPKDILIPKVMFIDKPEHLSHVITSIPKDVREKYTMVRSAPFFYEILHPEASKGNAVRQLANLLGIEQAEVMSIGDNGNDLTMIEWAGCGVAMANAIPEVLEAANFQTRSNNEHGVAHAIHELVLAK
ncbi:MULTISPECIES: sugar-phosphatase [Bacillus]|jgi:Cof subfamily protein (haloacid dehalogenase superfamily)|uniref:Promiscuous sugar phosphatase, haloacid dehalogenase-like phosphatase family n=1 Tax=Bacillus mojavensis TaxID=72360 RepID=A0AAP3CNR9_BACMO|nr:MULTISPECIES: sugar-phosphatase [Bacillus]MCC2929927.1 sugar-phosphatase [Bacillus sp. LBG-1-113]MCY8508557.1 sugar-phosphatase [Bacillus mojavensis]MCY9089672.1 sugar-phosphatase [Bacillus mojavensis]MDR4228411.1 sugar-phosphatase [Bacillus mojavensis]MEC1736466.1 sugar-phosphatase [Bacillus mojavensis]